VPITPHLIGAGTGILLLVGLWTPVGGVLVTIVELWIVLSRVGDPLVPLMLAILGATLAMIGPGAWSIDARLFGRKHIETEEQQTGRPSRKSGSTSLNYPVSQNPNHLGLSAGGVCSTLNSRASRLHYRGDVATAECREGLGG
jgi:hypothetical protein